MGRRSKQRRLSAAVKAAQENTDSGENSTTAGSGGSSLDGSSGLPEHRPFRFFGFPPPAVPNGRPHGFDDPHAHREGPFFGYEQPEMMAQQPSFAREDVSPGRGHDAPFSASLYPNAPVQEVTPHPEEHGTGSHLGFLSDPSREPATFALTELARENLLLKERLRQVFAEVQRLQELVRVRESEQGGGGRISGAGVSVSGGGGGGGKSSGESKKSSSSSSSQSQSRYWTEEEHQRFLEGMSRCGPKDMKGIAKHVGTRSSTQVRTHAQKYFLKLARAKKRADRGSTTSAGEDGFGHSAWGGYGGYDPVGGGGDGSVRWSSSPGENTSSGGEESGRGSEKFRRGGRMGGSSAGEGMRLSSDSV